MIKLEALPPLALYVHIPWCVRKCPYCDFNSHERAEALPENEYVARLIQDLEGMLPSIWGRRLVSVFIGGGTPSLFSPEAIDLLLSGIRARAPLEPLAEITLEANPGTVEAARFRGFRAAGVNRISLGVQSFDNVNVDIMYGLPGQSLAMASADVEEAVRSGAHHVSAYQLAIEPNTVFWSKPPTLPEHDTCADMQLAVEEILLRKGYEHYETSAFARPGHRCQHNLNYWEFGDYVGIGAGAHGKISFADRITRHERAKQPVAYLQGSSDVANRLVPAHEVPFEFMLNALRLVEGFPAVLFEERTGLSLLSIRDSLDRAERAGLLERDWKRVRPSERGRRFLNELLRLFLSAETRDPAPGGQGGARVIRISSPASR